MSMHKNVITLCCAAAFALGLAACSSSDDPAPPPPTPPVEPMPSAYEEGKAAIMAAMSPTEAQDAYDDVNKSMITAEQAESLMRALEKRVAMLLEDTAYERGKTAIMDAATPEAAEMAYKDINQDAITGQQAMELEDLRDRRVAELRRMDRETEQKMDLADAAGMLDTDDLSTQEAVNAAREAIVGLREALEAAEDVSDDDKAMYMSTLTDAEDAVRMAQGGIDLKTARMNQMDALLSNSMTLQAALAALSGATPTQMLLNDANNALTALNAAIAGGTDLTDAEKATYVREAANAMAPIEMAQTAFDDAEDEAGKADAAMMAATALKLHTGIGTDPLGGGRAAEHGTEANTNVGDIRVTTATGATPVDLSEDDDMMVADHYGWEGMMFTAEPDGEEGTYEAVVYSNVGEPTEGAKFSATYPYNATPVGTPSVNTELTIDTTATGVAGRVSSDRFDQSAGKKKFELGDLRRISIAGEYHGVPGTYYCAGAEGLSCTATVAADGFTLAGEAADGTAATVTWTFKATNAETRLMDQPDTMYASYGWWIHKSEDGNTFTASAFAVNRGAVDAASGIDTLRGSAKYVGGAAGKYALHSSTGGMNDAGHFTAKATLEADFDDDMITGTIDNFMGADGMMRDWSVELMEQGVNATGTILGDDGNGTAGY